jgi:HAD superfamily hydrolase (TIGR01509 family)
MSKANNRAVIWDMDGVIADTVIYHCRAWQHMLKKWGITMTEQEYRGFFGQRNDYIIRQKLGENISDDELNEFARKKEEYYYRLIEGNLKPLPGAIELIKALPTLDIRRYFEVYVAGHEVKEGKPSPQIYLMAAEKLGIEPSHCIVIEDALVGIEGASRAGMKCVAVATTHPKEKLSGADLVVGTLEEVSVSDLEKLLDSAKGKQGLTFPEVEN